MLNRRAFMQGLAALGALCGWKREAKAARRLTLEDIRNAPIVNSCHQCPGGVRITDIKIGEPVMTEKGWLMRTITFTYSRN